MKRTISEVIDLIKQKKESAEKTLIKLTNDLSPETLAFREKEEKFIARKVGYVEAYTDILALLETSHLVEQEKELETLKKVIDIFKKHLSVELWDMKEYYIANIKDPEYSNYNNCPMCITEEEKKVLEDCFNDN